MRSNLLLATNFLMIAQTGDEPNQRNVPSLDEALLGLGIGCALCMGGLVYVLKNVAQWTPINDSTYLALRNAYRVIDFLRLQSASPVATNVLRRQTPSGSERLGIEIFILLTVMSVAGALTLLLQLLGYARTAEIAYPFVGSGITSLILLGAIWAPAKTVPESHARDLGTVKIELAPGPCFGACPVYTFTVLADGHVEYVGRQGPSRFETRKQGKIERAKVMEILQTLNQVDFMRLEDRAFSWGFDTPSVGVRVWEDGKTKRVVSDAGFVGSKDGRQIAVCARSAED